jgi:hypothetical protein
VLIGRVLSGEPAEEYDGAIPQFVIFKEHIYEA